MTAEQNNHINPERVHHTYSELFPTEFEFLILYNLYINYPSAELQYAEIKQAIVDTSRLPFIDTGKDRQVERTFKGLLRTFIERVPSKFNHFILTPHAEKVVEMATHRINNPYLKFPLKDTFETYFTLPFNSGDDIKKLQAWFKFGFQNNARQVVIGHIDGLKLSVDDSVQALNQVLEADHLSAMQMLEQFSRNFQMLGDKARQITEAIRMKVDVHYQLRDTVEIFVNKKPTEETSVNDSIFQNNRQIALQIKEEVNSFFEKMDKQLDLINMKLGFASSKITELQESLRKQSQYKLNLKKMLVFLLENSKSDQQHWIKLPSKFPAKGLVAEKFRFRGIRYYDMGFLKRTKPNELGMDATYEEIQRNLFEQELSKQALIQEHCERIQLQLSGTQKINFSSTLFEIIKQENSIEIGIQTGYEVIRNLSTGNHVEIEEELHSNENNNIHLWKTTIHRG